MPKNLGDWIFGGILIVVTLCALEQNPGAFAALLYVLGRKSHPKITEPLLSDPFPPVNHPKL